MRNRKIKYQEHAIEVMSTDIDYHLGGQKAPPRKGGLKAPTGSGKTIMTCGILKEVSRRRNGNVAAVYLTPGSGELPKQARKVLSNALASSGMIVLDAKKSCTSCTAGMRNCVVVAGWEELNRHDGKTGKRSNVVMKDDGDELSFPEICKLTIDVGTPIVLVIDESHIGAETIISQEVIDLINPSYILYVSATLRNKVDFQHTIYYREVADEEMVKDSIYVETFDEYHEGVRNGADKIKELEFLFQEAGSKVLPKMLCFIPNDTDKSVELQGVLDVLRKEYGWTEDSGEVKVVLSGKRKTPGWDLAKGAEGNENKTKVFITKEAIATGVDIPSICVIVQMRPTNSKSAYLQKVGRGLRMPEKRHYKKKFYKLDILYYFVDSQLKLDFADVEELEERIRFVSYIRSDFRNVPSIFAPLPGSYYDREIPLMETVIAEFETIFRTPFLNKLQACGRACFTKWDRELELEKHFGQFEYDQGKFVKSGDFKAIASTQDVGLVYERIMRDKLKHLWKHNTVIYDAVYEFMLVHVNDGLPIGSDYVMTFILSNLDVIAPLLKEALEEAEVLYDKGRQKHTFSYVPPDKYEFIRNPNKTEEKKTTKCLYEPYYLDNDVKRSDPEDQCFDFIEQYSNVAWVCKNYDRKEGSFSITYIGLDGKGKTHYPDFIGMTKDGRTFVLEFKKGTLDAEKNNKRDALVEAIGNVAICGVVSLDTGWLYLDRNQGKERLDDVLKDPIVQSESMKFDKLALAI